jgi:predicted DNA-binding protein
MSMAKTKESARQSISLPTRVAKRVKAMAKRRRTSANRVLVDLIEAGLESQETEKKRFFALANRLSETRDASERKRLKEELARMTFGE